ncbi:MAG: DUF4276 family protein [Aureispira sp.]
MKRLIFIVEGQTEQEFVNSVIRPYFLENYNFANINAFCIQTATGHKGGLVKYNHLQKDIKRSLSGDVIVTTFLDFFRIPKTMPNYNLMLTIPTTDEKIAVLENGIKEDIDSYKFIPYIQKHEFEALLFSDNRGFEGLYEPCIYNKTQTIINAYPNPENINNAPETAPSKRLEKILHDCGERYDKVTEGNLIAEDIGINKMLEKCPRFKAWIETLVNRVIQNT